MDALLSGIYWSGRALTGYTAHLNKAGARASGHFCVSRLEARDQTDRRVLREARRSSGRR